MIHHKKLYISQIDINSWFLSVFESSEVKTANFVAMLVSFHPWCLCGDVSWSWLTNKCNGRLWWHQWHWWTVLTDHSNDDTVWLSAAQRFFLAEINTFFYPLILMFYFGCLLTYFSIIYCIKITFSSVFLIGRNDIPIIQNMEIIPISLLFVNSKGTSTCHS